MGIIFYGSKRTAIGYEELFVKCPCCEAHNWADAMVFSRYYHVYWLPIFPFDKEADVICQKCGLKRYGISFDSRLVSNFDEVNKGRFRHPWFSYAGVLLFGFVSLVVLAASIT